MLPCSHILQGDSGCAFSAISGGRLHRRFLYRPLSWRLNRCNPTRLRKIIAHSVCIGNFTNRLQIQFQISVHTIISALILYMFVVSFIMINRTVAKKSFISLSVRYGYIGSFAQLQLAALQQNQKKKKNLLSYIKKVKKEYVIGKFMPVFF